jgi:hypothetical protein
MKKFTLLALIALTVSFSTHAQLTKKSWLAGGSLGVSASSDGYLGTDISYSTYSIAPKAGYFFIDHLAAGILLNTTFSHYHYADQYQDQNQNSHSLGFGPFVRYYFLPVAKPVNILLEVYDQYTINGNNGSANSHTNSYGFAAGPTFFLNPSVALECTFGYAWTKPTAQTVSLANHVFKTAIGFQVYLPGKNHKS